MDNRIFVLSVMLLGVAYGTVISGKPDKLDSGDRDDLKIIGAVDGVTYYYEAVMRSWEDAGHYCESHGMHLALINTENQFNLLKWATFFYSVYWTAGKDSGVMDQYTWNNTNAAIPEFLGDDFHPGLARTCLWIHKEENWLEFSVDYCAARYYTMCSEY